MDFFFTNNQTVNTSNRKHLDKIICFIDSLNSNYKSKYHESENHLHFLSLILIR